MKSANLKLFGLSPASPILCFNSILFCAFNPSVPSERYSQGAPGSTAFLVRRFCRRRLCVRGQDKQTLLALKLSD
jgi:hypothetical protein